MPDYTLIRSRKRRKTITLQVHGDGKVIIRAPWSTPSAEADAFFSAKQPWLKEKLSRQRRYVTDFWSCGRLPYLGTSYPLEVLPRRGGPESFSFSDRRFFLHCDHMLRARAIMVAWLTGQAEEHFEMRIAHYEGVSGQRPAGFRLSNARYRWGSCSPRNRLFLNWRLIMAPPSVIDYVIVHELMHIREKNHSHRFWVLIARTFRDYEAQRRWLKENSFLLSV